MLIDLINKPAVVLVELRRAVEMLSGMRLLGLIYLINKAAVALVELRRAVEMLSASE